MTPVDFKAQAEALRDELIARRRDLHQHPEIAFEEVRTAGIVAKELTDLGLEVTTGVGRTGVVAMLEGEASGPTVLVRADMDALPVQEETGADYTSRIPGKMHACGHDGHTAIALAVAKMLSGQREQMAGRVKFVFQPAEEIAGGAKAMIKDGVLENPRPDVSLGLHLWNTLPLGYVAVTDGPSMAGSSSFSIVIKGYGAHAASPHLASDPVQCAVQIVSALQTIVSRNVDPLETAVVSVTTLRAGTADNIIPQEAEVRGTIRAFKPEVRALIEGRMYVIVENAGRMMNCSTHLSYLDGTIPVINDAKVGAKVREAMLPIIGDPDLILTDEQTMGAEDMGYLMDDVPGMYFFVGSANKARKLDYGHHHPKFDFDEDALPFAAALLANSVAAYVLPEVD